MIQIALLEDSTLWYKLIEKQLLDTHKFSISLHCLVGTDFMERCHTVPIDAVLLDINLPVTDGYAVFLQIRQVLPNIPIIVFTSSKNNYDITRFQQTDIAAYINKCRISRLGSDLEFVLKLKRMMSYNFKPISQHDLELMHLICEKLTYTQMASRLNKEPKTIENRLNQLCDKLRIDRKKIAVYEFCVRFGFWDPY